MGMRWLALWFRIWWMVDEWILGWCVSPITASIITFAVSKLLVERLSEVEEVLTVKEWM